MSNSDQFHVHLYGPNRGPLDRSFEDVIDRMRQLEKLYDEPDGSFVWNRDAGGQQIFGMIYDAASRVQYVEIRGTCGQDMWSTLVDSIGSVGQIWTVVSLADGSVQDLQSFEQMTWPNPPDSPEK